MLRRPVESAQYTSVIYGQALATHGLAASMGTRGCAYDNAACESVMSTIKRERHGHSHGGLAEANQGPMAGVTHTLRGAWQLA